MIPEIPQIHDRKSTHQDNRGSKAHDGEFYARLKDTEVLFFPMKEDEIILLSVR